MSTKLTVAEARHRILATLQRTPGESVSLAEALGRVLCAPVISTRDVPAFANSSMDGFAVSAADTDQAPVTLRITGESRAGHRPDDWTGQGTAIRISTGAMLPPGADAVVRVEDTAEHEAGVEIRVTVPPGNFIRHAGEDLRVGDPVIDAGVRLRSHHLGVCASLGVTHLAIAARPVVGLLSTGDELVAPEDQLKPGQVVDSNRVALGAAITEAGGVVRHLGVARDDPADVRAKLMAAGGCDLIVSSAGVSVGGHDHVRDVVAELGDISFWKVAMRPGKPLAFGHVGDIPFVGLPGNPVSSQVTFELFGRAAILALQGATEVVRRRSSVRLGVALDATDDVELYLRGRRHVGPDGVEIVVLTGGQGSGISRSLADADCLIARPPHAAAASAGELVEVIPLD